MTPFEGKRSGLPFFLWRGEWGVDGWMGGWVREEGYIHISKNSLLQNFLCKERGTKEGHIHKSKNSLLQNFLCKERGTHSQVQKFPFAKFLVRKEGHIHKSKNSLLQNFLCIEEGEIKTPIHPSTHPPIHPSTHLPIHPSTYTPLSLSTFS